MRKEKMEYLGLKVKRGLKKRMDYIAINNYGGISLSDYIRQVLINQVNMDESVLIGKGKLKLRDTGNNTPKEKMG